MIVNPKAITFFGNNIEAHVDVTNGGNNTFIFSVDGLPDGFTLHPMPHELQKGDTLPLVIIRSLVLLEPAVVQSSARSPFKFRVRTNLNDQEEVAIVIDPKNVDVWKNLGDQVKRESGKASSEISVNDALHTVNTSIKDSQFPEAYKYVLVSWLSLKWRSDVLR